MRLFVGIFALFSMTAAALAQPLSQREANAALFSVRGSAIQTAPSLTAQDTAIVIGVIDLLGKQLGGPVKYYASIAYSPSEGVVSESLQSALNFHSVAAADAAAKEACSRAKSRGSTACIVAARVVPQGYEPRGLTLSYDATNGFQKTYNRTRGPRALAASRSVPAWSIATTREAALAAC